MKMNFHSTLTNWYSVNKEICLGGLLRNPYNIWLSEIILQQTQIKQGQPYYEAFLSHYPTVQDLAKLLKQNFKFVARTWLLFSRSKFTFYCQIYHRKFKWRVPKKL